MSLMEKKDLRVQKTIRAIREAFEELICEKDYPKITVTELSERAHINKKTFYRYYPAMDNLLAELQMDLITGYLKLVENYRLPDEFNKVNEAFFRFSAEQSPAYEKITCHTNYSGIAQQMIDRVMHMLWNRSEKFRKLDVTTQNILMNFIQISNAEIYRQWVAEGKKMPIEELITMANTLICPGLEKFFDQIQ